MKEVFENKCTVTCTNNDKVAEATYGCRVRKGTEVRCLSNDSDRHAEIVPGCFGLGHDGRDGPPLVP